MQSYTGDIAGFIPDHHNKANNEWRETQKVMFTLYFSLLTVQ